MTSARRLILLTDGCRDLYTAKTAVNLLRYKPEDVLAVFDRSQAGRTAGDILGVGGSIPVIGNLDDAPGATALLIGIAPAGGKIPPAWRHLILQAIERKLDIVSGLHDFLIDDVEFAAAATRCGAKLIDVRRNDEHDVAHRQGIREGCLRVHTVGHDCSCGKMLASVEIARGLARRGVDAKFVATGQTGILIEGDGCPIDRVISDFVNGAAEKLVLANQHHSVIVVEGQGTLFHPRYSCVTLGLLHGSLPDAMILCYEMGRTHFHGMEQFALPSLEEVIEVYEKMAGIMHRSRVIGVAMNSYRFGDREAAAERDQVRRRLGLPVCDVVRHGPDELLDAILAFKRQVGK